MFDNTQGVFSNKLLITFATRKMKDSPRLIGFFPYCRREAVGKGGVGVNHVMKQDPYPRDGAKEQYDSGAVAMQLCFLFSSIGV
jgi:hypothetical protein